MKYEVLGERIEILASKLTCKTSSRRDILKRKRNGHRAVKIIEKDGRAISGDANATVYTIHTAALYIRKY